MVGSILYQIYNPPTYFRGIPRHGVRKKLTRGPQSGSRPSCMRIGVGEEVGKPLLWKLNNKMLGKMENMRCLVPSVPPLYRMDCVLNALDFLEQIDDKTVATYMACVVNETRIGIDEARAVHIMYFTNSTNEFKYDDILLHVNVGQTPNWVDALNAHIGEGNCTIFLMYNSTNHGHMVIVAVMAGALMVIDQQMEIVMPLREYLAVYFPNLAHFRLIYRRKHKKRVRECRWINGAMPDDLLEHSHKRVRS